MGPRLSAALALRPKHLDRPSLLGSCAVVADCSRIVAWLQTRSSTGAASSGSSPRKIANWSITPQQIAFAVISTGGSSWSIAVTFEDPSGVYPSPISSAPTGFTILAGSSNQSSRWDRACSSHCGLASDDGGAVTMSALPPQNRHRQLDRQCPESAITGLMRRSRVPPFDHLIGWRATRATPLSEGPQ